jgi:hypothetical protein
VRLLLLRFASFLFCLVKARRKLDGTQSGDSEHDGTFDASLREQQMQTKTKSFLTETEFANTPNRTATPLSETALIETIRDPKDPTRFLFLIWEGEKATIVPHLQRNGRLFRPPEIDVAAHADLRLPDRILPSGDSRELLADLSSTLSKFVDFAEDDCLLASMIILSSWFPDCMKVAPYLWLVGPLESGKTTLLRLLHCLCRRALLIGDLRGASLYKFSSLLHPTLILDEFEMDSTRMGAEVRRLLRNGSTQGVPVARNGKLFDVYGPKVIASRQPPPDVALASRAIIIRLLPTQKNLLPLDEAAMERISSAFQPRLFMYRLQNRSRVKEYRISVQKLQGLNPRTRDLAQAMAAPLLGEAMLEDKLFAILREYDREARVERSLEPEWLVVEALFDLCHEGIANNRRICEILVGGVSTRINKSLTFRGEDIRVTAKKVSGVLKGLGIRTRRLGNLGRGLTFTSAAKRKIHDLARRLGFDRADFATLPGLESGYGGTPCALCEQFDLTGNLRFVDVQATPRLKFRSDQRCHLFDQTAAADAEHQGTSNACDEIATR